jgi:hypothetical protein
VNDPSVTVASNNTVVTALNALTNDTLSGISDYQYQCNAVRLAGGRQFAVTQYAPNPSTGLNVSPANCDTATATVVVNNPVDAVNDPSVTVAQTIQ